MEFIHSTDSKTNLKISPIKLIHDSLYYSTNVVHWKWMKASEWIQTLSVPEMLQTPYSGKTVGIHSAPMGVGLMASH